MNTQKNQKTQLIILLSLAAVVVTLGIYRFVASDAKNPEVANRQQVAVTQERPGKDSAGDEVASASAETEIQMVASAGTEQARDPFAVQVGAKKEVSTPTARVNTGGTPPLLRAEPIPPIFGFDSQRQGTTGQVGLPTIEEPAPQLQLTGVVEGPVSVAIIRGPDDTRYIVREGQVIEGRYRVDSISRFGVKLKYRDKSLILRLGETSTG